MKKTFAFIIAVVLLLSAGISKYDRQRIVIAGSSCMGRMMAALADGYSEETGILTQSQLGGTQLGLIALEKGGCDIASVSRELTEAEKEWAEPYPIATDVIAVIVNNANSVNDITLDELRDIYSGKTVNWSQLGGEDIPIVVIGREAGSGTRAAFDEAIKTEYPVHDQEHSENGILRTAVSMTRGAVGYISFDFVTDDVKPLTLDGAALSGQAALSGEYPVTREFLLCIKKGESRDELLEFIDYATNEKGKAVIRSLGMVPFSGKDYVSAR